MNHSRAMKMSNPPEHNEQRDFVNWVKKKSLQDPIYDMLYAIPNGGQRNLKVGAKLKLEGVKPGIPDLCFPVSRGPFHGLYIEMKRKKTGHLSKVQKEWKKKLKNQNYCFQMARGSDEAIKILEDYLRQDKWHLIPQKI